MNKVLIAICNEYFLCKSDTFLLKHYFSCCEYSTVKLLKYMIKQTFLGEFPRTRQNNQTTLYTLSG